MGSALNNLTQVCRTAKSALLFVTRKSNCQGLTSLGMLDGGKLLAQRDAAIAVACYSKLAFNFEGESMLARLLVRGFDCETVFGQLPFQFFIDTKHLYGFNL